MAIKKPDTKGTQSTSPLEKKSEINQTNLGPKTEAPLSEAMSHKPTQGLASEKPEAAEPESDPTTEANSANVERKTASANPTNQPDHNDEDRKIDEAAAKIESKFNPSNLLDEQAKGQKPLADDTANTGQAEDQGKDEKLTGKDPSDHSNLPDDVRETLQSQVDAQSSQLNPDEAQSQGHWPSTESLTGAPTKRTATIDPMTGQVHYAGDAASLPGATVVHENDE